MKSHEMKHEMTLFHTMEPNKNVLFQLHLLFVIIYGLVWSSSVKLDDVGPFERPLLLRTPLYLVMVSILLYVCWDPPSPYVYCCTSRNPMYVTTPPPPPGSG